jgi:orotate phosphoribosyltransferase
MVYVRSGAKDHGLGNQVEGRLLPGQSVVVVVDLITTGGSALGTAEALRAAGGTVANCVAIFTYSRAKADTAFASAGIVLSTLSDIHTLLALAVDEGQLTADQREEVRAWLAAG